MDVHSGKMELKEFLVAAKRNTYASNNPVSEIKRKDGGRELRYKKNDFSYRDIYFGSNPFSGQEVVWHKKKILWSMVYYGFVLDESLVKEVIIFLKECLRKVDKKNPYRGPKKYLRGDFKYENFVKGTINHFSCYEIIYYKKRRVYTLVYYGGLIKN